MAQRMKERGQNVREDAVVVVVALSFGKRRLQLLVNTAVNGTVVLHKCFGTFLVRRAVVGTTPVWPFPIGIQRRR